jgi:AbrB family looped-hinge helix DNA binding protein
MGMPVTVKGQVTIPKPIRDRLGLTPGSKVDFEVVADGQVMLRKAEAPPAVPDRFRRLLGRATAGLSTDAIMAMTRGED